METTARLRRAVANPRLFARGLNRAYHRRGGLRTENPNGVAVFAEDWDTLVVLDACRYDMFTEQHQLEGTLTVRESRGSSTVEWLRANVAGRDLRDTVYVTANPQLERHRDEWEIAFHEVDNVWLKEGWDEETGTVRAETMTTAARQAHEAFPHKRLVVHYMQPHYPFVPVETSVDTGHLDSIEGADDTVTGENVWNRKFLGELDVSRDRLWEMYTANLRYVVEHVDTLVTELSGKTVVTADHGNYVGERAFPVPIREYGHPRGLYDGPLVRVPWLECPFETRRSIERGTQAETTATAADVVSDRLQDLGYVQTGG
jgi:hypothetical protein